MLAGLSSKVTSRDGLEVMDSIEGTKQLQMVAWEADHDLPKIEKGFKEGTVSMSTTEGVDRNRPMPLV